jgi:modulator of FtsH protease
MHLEVTAGWDNFLVAEVGASAALLGLLFVAVSINLTQILKYSHLPARALEALGALLCVLVVATLLLVPGQSTFAYGVEMAATGFLTWAGQTRALFASGKSVHALALRILLNQLPALSFLIGGIQMAAGSPSGIYWIVPGTLLSLLASVSAAWVLLVEIQR